MKLKIIGIVAFVIIALTGCTKSETLKSVSYDDLAKKINNDESFVLYVGSSDCSHCIEFKPTLEKVIKDYKLDVYYINMQKLSKSKYAAVMDKVDGEGTPTVVYIEKGKTKTSPRIEGTRDYDTTVQFFKDLKLIENEG